MSIHQSALSLLESQGDQACVLLLKCVPIVTLFQGKAMYAIILMNCIMVHV